MAIYFTSIVNLRNLYFLFLMFFFPRGKYYTHAVYRMLCNQGEFFPFLPFITVVKTGILMCNFISPTSNLYSGFVTQSKYINFKPKGTLTGSTGKVFEGFGACVLSR